MPSAPRWSPNVNVTTSGGASVTSGENIVVGAPGTFVGNLSGTADSAGTASAISVTANSTSTSYRIGFLGNSTGETAVHSDGNLTYNPSTNNLTTTTFTGNLSGNASTSTSATSATSASTITTTASSTNTNYSVPFLSSTSGNVSLYNDGGLIYNPSTNVLDVAGRLVIGNTYAIDTVTSTVSGESNLTVSWPSPSQSVAGTISGTNIRVPYSGLWSINVQATSSTFNGASVFGLTVPGSMWITNNSYGVLSTGLPAYTGTTYVYSCNFTGYLASTQTNTVVFRNNRNDGVSMSVAFEIECRLQAMI